MRSSGFLMRGGFGEVSRLFVLVLAAIGCLDVALEARAQAAAPIPAGDVRIHYYRPDGAYAGWALYTWNAANENASWCNVEVPVTGTDEYGVYYDVAINPAWGTPPGDLGFILNNCGQGQIKDPGPDQHLDTNRYKQAWVVSGDATVYTTEPTAAQKLSSLFSKQQAYWMDRSRVAIPAGYFNAANTYTLVSSLTGGLQPEANGVTGGQAIPLAGGGTLTEDELARFPQLASYAVLTVRRRCRWPRSRRR